MRLARLSPADLKEGGRLTDEMRTLGFFSGPRVVLLEGAGDAQASTVEAAISDWREGDATLLVTAGSLATRSALRKVFEQHDAALAVAIYDDPPDRAEIDALLAGTGLDLSREAAQALHALAQSLEPGDFRQTVDTIAIYKIGDERPLTPDEIELLAPATVEAALDDAVNAAADADLDRLGPLVRRLEAQGTTPVSICIAAGRHFRGLLAAASDPAGPAAALGRMRPPVWGPRRESMRRQASAWGAPRLDAALRLLVDTDLRLRSSSPGPGMAVMERTLIRLAMMARH
jgi:DNA polymerase-3 subunit delta